MRWSGPREAASDGIIATSHFLSSLFLSCSLILFLSPFSRGRPTAMVTGESCSREEQGAVESGQSARGWCPRAWGAAAGVSVVDEEKTHIGLGFKTNPNLTHYGAEPNLFHYIKDKITYLHFRP